MFTTLQRFDEHVTDTFIYVLPFLLIEQLHSATILYKRNLSHTLLYPDTERHHNIKWIYFKIANFISNIHSLLSIWEPIEEALNLQVALSKDFGQNYPCHAIGSEDHCPEGFIDVDI